MVSSNVRYLVEGQGSPLTATTAPVPTIADPKDVIIRIKAIAINPADCKMIYRGHRAASWPLVPGLDGAGVVEAVGSDVKHFKPGDRVVALFTPGNSAGSYQTFSVVKEPAVAKIPDSWSFEEGASLGVCFSTAVIGLGLGLQIPLPFLKDGQNDGFKPSSVLVLGGSSALGASTIQLLRLALPDCTILTTSSPKHHSHLTNTLGADKAFDRSSASLVTDIKAATAERGVEAIFDAVGAGLTERHVFDAFDGQGPKAYAQVWTGDDEIQVPNGVNSVLFRGRDVPRLQGGQNIPRALQDLLQEGKYKLPLPVCNMGEGLDGLEKGLSAMLKGVSGEKLVVTV